MTNTHRARIPVSSLGWAGVCACRPFHFPSARQQPQLLLGSSADRIFLGELGLLGLPANLMEIWYRYERGGGHGRAIRVLAWSEHTAGGGADGQPVVAAAAAHWLA